MVGSRVWQAAVLCVLGCAVWHSPEARGESWQQQAKLTASYGGEGDYFGKSVSIGGGRAVVGAPGENDNGFWSGSAYVFGGSGGPGGGSTLTVFPPSGYHVTTQKLDVTLIAEAPGLSVVGVTAMLDGTDVSVPFMTLAIPGTLRSGLGGETLRAPDVAGAYLGPGSHTFTAIVDLSDGSSLSDAVFWDGRENTEP